MSDEFTMENNSGEIDSEDVPETHPRFGSLPDGWQIKEISEVAEVVGGSTPSTDNEDYWDGGIPWATPTDITNLSGNEISETENTLTKEGLESASTHLLPPKSVLMTSRATIGKCAINTIEMATNQGFKSLVPSEGVEPWYLFYRMLDTAAFLDSLGAGSTFDEVSKTTVQAVDIPVPPLEEQRKIATVLYTVDQAMQKTEEIINQLESVEKGLKQDLLIDGIKHSEYQDVDIGPKTVKIPQNWDLMQIDEIGKINASNVDKKSNESETPVQLCNYMDVYENEYITDDIDFMEATASAREIGKFSIEKGDVIFTKDSEDKYDIAVPAVVRESLNDIVCGYHLYLLKPNEEIALGEYISKALQSYPVKSQLSSKAQGLTRYGLNVPAVEKSVIPIPPINEQKRIIEVFRTIDGKISNNESLLAELKRVKSGLMQDIISGRVRTHNKDIEIIDEILAHG